MGERTTDAPRMQLTEGTPGGIRDLLRWAQTSEARAKIIESISDEGLLDLYIVIEQQKMILEARYEDLCVLRMNCGRIDDPMELMIRGIRLKLDLV